MADFLSKGGWVLIILGIIAVLHVAFSISDKRNEAKRRARVSKTIPIIKDTSQQVIRKLKNRYPNIPFDLYLVYDYDQLVNQYTTSHTTSVKEIANKVLSLIGQNAITAYKGYIPYFLAQVIASEELKVSAVQFEDEQNKTRIRKISRNWPDIRQEVYKRDNGRCQRCGTEVSLERCHIHHVAMRLKGGTDSPENLLTLCRDCHALMEEHGFMHSVKLYYLSDSGLVHTATCYHAPTANPIWDTLPRIEAKGYFPCQKCKPRDYHRYTQRNWKPEIERFLTRQMQETLSSL